MKTVYEEARAASDKESLAAFLCQVITLGELGCDGCPVTDLCHRGRNGFEELLAMPRGVLTEEGVAKKWREEKWQ